MREENVQKVSNIYKGFYTQYDLIFEGIKLKFEAEANAGLTDEEDENENDENYVTF